MAKAAPRRPATKTKLVTPGGLTLNADEIISDYRLAVRSRAASVIGRREVLTGKAGFGIFGAGQDLPRGRLARRLLPGPDADVRDRHVRPGWLLRAALRQHRRGPRAGLRRSPDAEPLRDALPGRARTLEAAGRHEELVGRHLERRRPDGAPARARVRVEALSP